MTIIARLINGPCDGELHAVPDDKRVLIVALLVDRLTAREERRSEEAVRTAEVEYVRADHGFPGVPVPFLWRRPDGTISAAWEGDYADTR